MLFRSLGWRFPNPRLKEQYGNDSMGETAENVAALAQYADITREVQDAFALESHRRAVRAIDEGRFAREIVPCEGLAMDETARRDTTLERMATLEPLRKGGRITAASLRIALVPGMFFGASTILGFTAFMTTSVANATLIGNVASAFTLFLAPRVLGERVRPVQVGLALCSFAGVALMVFGAGGTGGATLHGDALALGNAAT